MLSLNGMNLSRFILFDKVDFQFKKGISLINGRNKSGKSLLFKGISTAFYGKETGDKLPLSSTIGLDYSNILLVGDKEKADNYQLSIKTNKSPSYTLLKNEDDLHPHKISDALNLIKKSNSIPYPLWLATVDLSSKDHPLTHGSPATKAEWLSLVLDLSTVYDGYLQAVKLEMDKIEKAKTEYNVLAFEKEEIEKNIPDNTSGIRSKDHLEEIKSKLQLLVDKRKEIVNSLLSIQSQIVVLEQIPEEYETFDDGIKAEKKAYQKMLQERERLKIIQKEAKEFESIEDSDIEKLSKLRKYAKFSKKMKDFQSYKKELGALVDDYYSDKKKWEAEREYREQLKSLKADNSTDVLHDTKALTDKTFSIKAEMDSLKEYGKNLSDLIDGVSDKAIVCSSCGSVVDVKHAKKELKKMREKYASLQEEYDDIRKKLKAASTFDTLVSRITMKKAPIKPENEIHELKRVNLIIDRVNEYRELKEKIGGVTPPEYSLEEVNQKLARIEKKIDKKSNQLSTNAIIENAIRNCRDEVVDIIQQGPAKLSTHLTELKKKRDTLTESQERISKKVETLRYNVQAYEAYKTARSSHTSNLSRLAEKLEELKKITKNYEAYKALQLAFGNNGLRLHQLQESASHLSNKMTELSTLFYGHQYKFNVDVKPRKLDLIVERNGIEGSLKSLSGSESRLFSLLFAMSLLYVLPNRLRCDTMILDELEANQDQPAREVYAQEILPELSNLIDKVVVVSPLMYGELNVSADYKYLISKRNKNGRWLSSLSEG